MKFIAYLYPKCFGNSTQQNLDLFPSRWWAAQELGSLMLAAQHRGRSDCKLPIQERPGFKIQSTVSAECTSLLHHCTVEKS